MYYDKDGNELKTPSKGKLGHGRPNGQPPKLYDKDGNEVQGPPQAGVAYYDKDGKELKAPEKPAR